MQKLHTVPEYPVCERQITRMIAGSPHRSIYMTMPDLKIPGIEVPFPFDKKYSEILINIFNARVDLQKRANQKLLELHRLGKHHPEPSKIRESLGASPEKDLSPAQLAQASGFSKMTITRHCHSGIIKANRTSGGHWKIPIAEGVKYLNERNIPLPPDFS